MRRKVAPRGVEFQPARLGPAPRIVAAHRISKTALCSALVAHPTSSAPVYYPPGGAGDAEQAARRPLRCGARRAHRGRGFAARSATPGGRGADLGCRRCTDTVQVEARARPALRGRRGHDARRVPDRAHDRRGRDGHRVRGGPSADRQARGDQDPPQGAVRGSAHRSSASSTRRASSTRSVTRNIVDIFAFGEMPGRPQLPRHGVAAGRDAARADRSTSRLALAEVCAVAAPARARARRPRTTRASSTAISSRTTCSSSMIATSGRVKLLDFGIAKLSREDRPGRAAPRRAR